MNLLATIVGLLVSVSAVADFKVPATPNPVNDYSNVLTRGGKERIAKAAVLLKRETGAQVGVVIVDTLDGSNLEESSMAVAKSWGLGSSAKDDGLLIFVVSKDRKMRLEVGRGLEGIFTDYQSKQVTVAMKPGLRAGNYDEAILAAIITISDTIKARASEVTTKPGAKVKTASTEDSSTGVIFFLLALFGLGGIISFFVVLNNKEKERKAAERRLARQPQTPEQRRMAQLMYEDVQKRAKKDPGFPKPEKKSRSRDDDDDGFTTGVVVGSLLSRSSSDDSGSGGSGGSSDSGGSFGGSDFGGGGGDFSGGGSSDSF